MIRMLSVFFVLFVVFWFGISVFRSLTGREKWEVIKVLGYSALCSALSIGVLVLLVIFF